MVLAEKLQGDTVHLKAMMTDTDLSTPIDVTSHDILIIDSEGNQVDEVTSVTHGVTGTYTLNWQIPLSANVGIWFVYWSALFVDGFKRRQVISFEVVAQ
jgi:uncharacterized protein YfaS (alpha-2-macroglobulin family)